MTAARRPHVSVTTGGRALTPARRRVVVAAAVLLEGPVVFALFDRLAG
jgi:hypothetical protein